MLPDAFLCCSVFTFNAQHAIFTLFNADAMFCGFIIELMEALNKLEKREKKNLLNRTQKALYDISNLSSVENSL